MKCSKTRVLDLRFFLHVVSQKKFDPKCFTSIFNVSPIMFFPMFLFTDPKNQSTETQINHLTSANPKIHRPLTSGDSQVALDPITSRPVGHAYADFLEEWAAEMVLQGEPWKKRWVQAFEGNKKRVKPKLNME